VKKILIVDDELPLLKIMTDEFVGQGFKVITAQNGADGFKAAIENHPDLIILDIRMPVMDGIAMVKKLRQDKWGSDAAVMVLTNVGDSENVSTLMNDKITNFYVKTDWKLEDIVKQVKERLPLS
jgi:response regulator RpfG family c-di-GMP phosphodiesterase